MCAEPKNSWTPGPNQVKKSVTSLTMTDGHDGHKDQRPESKPSSNYKTFHFRPPERVTRD